MSTTETINRIIESAENQARSGGYNAFSFREIAKDIGIKSASIHYHFPTKADLAAALAKRYTEKFSGHLSSIENTTKDLHGKLSDYADLFYFALKTDQKMCLCGLFAAEMDVLPSDVKTETRQFFETNLSWLEQLFADNQIDSPKTEAMKLLANMEGAMLLAKAFESEEHFKQSIDLSIYK
ncbi:MAG: TetR/AcrR family transcriptional regulator [Cellvibrionaceae bacterium]